FARWLGLGCLVAILALVGNAIVLSVQGRIAEHAVLQTIGYRGGLIARLIVAEAVLLALVGGVIGGATALVVARIGSFALSVEGLSIPVVASPTLLVTGLGICAALGAAAGLVPAVQASRRHIASCFRAA
ncbi:MAG: FtsX-like permease family protein, partial [Phycisphaerales bacterium]|nr:FtsX-like permease family protein [Phycisphaerales bacterium]